MKSLHVRVAHLIDEGKAVAKVARPAAGPYSMHKINFLQDLAIGPHTLPSPLILDEQTIRTLSKL